MVKIIYKPLIIILELNCFLKNVWMKTFRRQPILDISRKINYEKCGLKNVKISHFINDLNI